MKVVIKCFSISKEQAEEIERLQQVTGQSASSLVRQAINLLKGVYGYGQADEKCPLDKVAD